MRTLTIHPKTTTKSIAEKNIQRGIMAVEIRSHHGLGAKLEWVLEILAFCEEKKLTPQFKFTYPGSNDDENYFKSFFEINKSSYQSNSVEFVTIFSIHDLNLDKNYDEVLNIRLASYLINKYLTVKDDVLREVDEFCIKHFKNKRVLGTHFRGTDKLREATPVSYDKVKRNITFYLDKFPETECVFLSSDDENFIKFIDSCCFSCPVVYRNDSYRTVGDVAIHHSNQNKYDINRDAIVNCLILSRCDALMKTASILSAWSKLFSPHIPLVMLNKPFNSWFPERDMLNDVLYEPVQ